ncbi:hypothetical protein DXG01_016056 [Tephrocybe rancida]|nr:hypothetical protein DXG01_016056 [Tephrocybe rancida]
MGTIITKKRVKGEQITIETPVVAATFTQTVPPFEHSEGYTPLFEDSVTSFDIDPRTFNFALKEQDTSSPGSLGSTGPAFTHIKTPATDNRGNPVTSKGNGAPSPPAKATVESRDVPYDMPGNAPSPHESPSDTSPRSAIPGDASFDTLTLDE